jgi:hypothetical protein
MDDDAGDHRLNNRDDYVKDWKDLRTLCGMGVPDQRGQRSPRVRQH